MQLLELTLHFHGMGWVQPWSLIDEPREMAVVDAQRVPEFALKLLFCIQLPANA
jgi:hypothetical protein